MPRPLPKFALVRILPARQVGGMMLSIEERPAMTDGVVMGIDQHHQYLVAWSLRHGVVESDWFFRDQIERVAS